MVHHLCNVLTDPYMHMFLGRTHTMQSIQDQQNSLIGAVSPLVLTLRGVSPQMDQFKGLLFGMVANTSQR